MSSRQLAAILFADISGYTALMEDDEANAVALCNKFHHSLDREVASHKGWILKSMGDGSLCMFNSTLEAVQAAIALQTEMVQEPRVPLRIGIHSGDILTEAEDVYGDGVNIASRLESFAVPGSILVSGRVYDDLKNQKSIHAVSLGPYAFKNVVDPVEVYAISSPGLTVPGKGALEGKGHKAPKGRNNKIYVVVLGALLLVGALVFFGYRWWRPLHTTDNKLVDIAVLPFRTESSTGEKNEFFSNGMMEALRNNLAQVKSLRVISGQSSEQYRNSRKSIRQIAQELGVTFILQGSVQRIGNKVKISAQLVDAAKDRYVWSSSFPGELSDVFGLQEDIALKITDALEVNLSQNEKIRIGRVASAVPEALDAYYEAQSYYDKYAYSLPREETLYPVIQALCRRALRADPNLAEAYILLGNAFWLKNMDYNKKSFYREDLADSLQHLARRALTIDPQSPQAFVLLGKYYSTSGKKELAIEQLNKAIARNPNLVDAYLDLQSAYVKKGLGSELIIRNLKKALSLDPQSILTPGIYSALAGMYLDVLDYEKAITYANRAIHQEINQAGKASALRTLVAMDLRLGRIKEGLQNGVALQQYDSSLGYYFLAEFYADYKKDYKQALQIYQQAWRVNPERSNIHRYAVILYKLNRKAEALALMDSSLAKMKEAAALGRFPFENYDVAGIYAFLGKKEEAYRILRRPAEDHDVWGWGEPDLIKIDPLFDNLRNDKEFNDIVSKVQEEKRKLRERIQMLEAKGEL